MNKLLWLRVLRYNGRLLSHFEKELPLSTKFGIYWTHKIKMSPCLLPIRKPKLTTTFKIYYNKVLLFSNISFPHLPMYFSSKVESLNKDVYKSHFLCLEDHSLVHLKNSSTSLIKESVKSSLPSFPFQSANSGTI